MTATPHPNLAVIGEFASWTDGPVVSIYLPIQPEEQGYDLNAQLKSAAQAARDALVTDHGQDPAAAAELLAPVSGAALAPAAPGRGAAWFLAPGRATCVSLPDPVTPAVSIGRAPDTVGLLPYVSDGPAYYVLAISQRRARVFRADRFEIEPVPVPDMPKSLDDALWYARREPVLNRHGSGVLHGSGGGQDLRKDDVHQYLHMVDKALAPLLAGSHAPLVVMGVGYEANMFVNETHYRYVVDPPVVGNPDTLDVATIHERTWAVVSALPGATHAAAERARELAGTGRALTDVTEIGEAAAHGAVSDIVVARSVTQNPASAGSVELSAAVHAAVAHGAAAHVVDDGELPPGARVAAVLRY